MRNFSGSFWLRNGGFGTDFFLDDLKSYYAPDVIITILSALFRSKSSRIRLLGIDTRQQVAVLSFMDL
jgi:ribulose bisphosphate carboxylase small subunit